MSQPETSDGAIDAHEMDDLGEILAGIAVEVAVLVEWMKPRETWSKVVERLGVVRRHQDEAELGDERRRARLLQEPAIDLGRVDADHALDRRRQRDDLAWLVGGRHVLASSSRTCPCSVLLVVLAS